MVPRIVDRCRPVAVPTKGGSHEIVTSRTVVSVALVAAATCASLAKAEQSLVQAQATIPADLQALEQKMAQLHVNSERFSISMYLSLELGQGQQLPFLLGGSGVASQSPQEGEFTVGVLGQGVESRVIGGTVYHHEQSITEYDGNRPWVRSPHKLLGEAIAVSPTAVVGESPPGVGTFAHLIEDLNSAESYLEVGPAIVEGQQTTEFSVELNAETALKNTSTGVLPELTKHKPVSVELEVFVAPNGLPVRTGVRLEVEHRSVWLTVDILAIEVPVEVKPPPTRETIGEAALKKLQRKRAKCPHLSPARRSHMRVCRGSSEEIKAKLIG